MKTEAPIMARLAEAGVRMENGIALPETKEQVECTLRLAEECHARVLPMGAGSQYPAWTSHSFQRAPAQGNASYDFGLSLRNYRGEFQYDPAEGVVIAPAGMPWTELQARVSAQEQVLSPNLVGALGEDTAGHLEPEAQNAPARTVGGVVAAGISGPDRDFYGALRHQVLGVQVCLADQSSAQCGGRLVKNVTGFALQSLFTGSRGKLGLILEVSLRVWPKPAAQCVWPILSSGDPASLRAWQRLRAEHIPGLSVRFEAKPGEPARWHVMAQGTWGAIRDIEARVLRCIDQDPSIANPSELRAQWEREWCQPLHAEWLWVQCAPSEAGGVFESLRRPETPWAARFHWWGLPEVAEWRGQVLCEAGDAQRGLDWRTALEANLDELPCHWRWLGQEASRKGCGGPPRSPNVQAAQAALRLEFDPKSRWQPHALDTGREPLGGTSPR